MLCCQGFEVKNYDVTHGRLAYESLRLVQDPGDIRYCTNCLKCYGDLESEIAPCTHDDDMTLILEKIKEADGVLLGSPVHMAFITGLMFVFMERAVFRLARPTGEMFGLKGVPEPRLADKPRAIASIVTAGMVPDEMRPYCDEGTKWLKDNVPMIFNGDFVIDQYAAAYFPKELSDDEWQRALFLRELTEKQHQDAFEVGKTLATRISQGSVRPFDATAAMEASEQPESRV